MKSGNESKGILGTLMYLAFGLLVYVVLFQPETGFSWANPWTYIVAVFWPFALIYKFTVAIVVLVLIAIALAFVIRKLSNWRHRLSDPGGPDRR